MLRSVQTISRCVYMMTTSCIDISLGCNWCWQWHHHIHKVTMIKMRWNMTFSVMWWYWYQHCCHMMLTVSSMTLLRLLGEDTETRCHMTLLVMWCCWHQCQQQRTLVALPMAPFSLQGKGDWNKVHYHLLGYYLCLYTCWIKLEVLKHSKIILKSLTSFRWHPYWSHFIRSLRNVRLNKINERTPTSSQPPSAWTISFQPYMYQSHGQMGYQSLQNPPHPGTIIPSTKRPQLCHYPKILPPIAAYITSTEQAANKLPSQEADELRSGVNRILKQLLQQHNKQCNLNPSQCRALTELKQDNSRVVLTVEKGVAMVIMDQQDYINKAQTLLQDTNTYKVLPKDPTSHIKNKLITLLKDIKQTGGLSTQKYKQLYPTSAVPPKFYGLPKIHKEGTPLRPIVSSRGSITYGVAKELSHIIKPLVGQSPHHLKNSQHFIQQLQGKRFKPGETITSFDVKALFTSVPVQPSMQIVKQRLQQDNTLPQRTSMSIPKITSLLEFCLSHTYFLFQGKYYEQVQGAAMGSPISPLIANIFMEEFEVQALSSSPPPSLWLRFVDDTFVINKAEHSQELLQHINNQDPHIQFTVEPTWQDTSCLGHSHHYPTRQHLQHYSLQKTHPHRSIFALGQQPPHDSKTKCLQHPGT